MPEDEHAVEGCPACNPPVDERDIGAYMREVLRGTGVEGPDDDDYIDRPALGRTHPYGTRSV